MSKKNNLNTLVLGLEHFIDKIGYQCHEYASNHISIRYLISDKSGCSQVFAKKYDADIEILPISKLKALFVVAKNIIKYRPEFIEVYDTGNMFFFYTVIAFLLNRRIVIIYRGGELQRHKGNKWSVNYYKHLIATKIAFKIVAKEKNIQEEYKLNNFPQDKIHFLHNCVPLANAFPNKGKREIDLLFLNSVRKSRNVPFLLDVIAELYKVMPELTVTIAGFNSLDEKNLSYDYEEEQYILRKIKRLGLEDVINVHGFVTNPMELQQNSKLFVFPAQIVFANYSLLESMSAGCVPIVSNGEGADLIVSENEGEVLELSISDWVEAIKMYLNNPELLEKKSQQSIKRIEEEFSIKSWFSRMMDIRHD